MNVSERDLSILKHIIEYCDQIDLALDHFGAEFELFDNDPVFRNSVSLCILQIGELVGILSDEFKETHPDVPWRQIKQVRNIVAHRYGTVDNTITWDIINNDIPQLRAFCSSSLEVGQ